MPELPTSPRGAATSRRILDAAAEEFAQRGIAGARIDRITAAARTNKAQVYGYFGSKDGLFDAVIADLADRLMSAVPLDAADLPGWAVGMYLRAGDPADLIGLVIAMACAWSPASSFYAATADEPAADHDRRRALLHDCVARAVAP